MAAELVTLVAAILGLLLTGLGLRRLVWQRRLVRGSIQSLAGLSLLGLAATATAILFNIYTYQRLTHEELIAELQFSQIGPQHYRVYVEQADGTAHSYNLRGDEWQIDARILKWQGTANLLGFNTLYRLERLGGRYRETRQEMDAPRTVYRLAEDRGLDLWRIAHQHPGWLPGVDAIYGSAAYLPMADRARFVLHHSQSGLVARPLNEAARRAVETW
ncbi:MAG TPA: cation/multidrug efflux pump [Gammaproteobacteria bacterium]|nr:cation/multidrug efflux pump [Gammaproteobacteria bacterium]